jgi:hypothetical protein
MKLQNQPLDSKLTNSKVFDKIFIQNQERDDKIAKLD